MDQEFSEIFAGRRQLLGLTQASVARHMNITVSRVSRAERGVELIGWRRLPKLAKLLKLPTNDLLAASCVSLLRRQDIHYSIKVLDAIGRRRKSDTALRRIQQLRQDRQLSIRELSAISGMKHSYVGKVCNPSTTTILEPLTAIHFAGCLGSPPTQLVALTFQDLLFRHKLNRRVVVSDTKSSK